MAKTHLELYGWQIERVQRPLRLKGEPEWFRLWVRGYKTPYAGGPLEHVAKVLNRIA